jgi:hypothetical protein
VRREGMIEGLAIDVLGVRRKVRLHRGRQIAVGSVWHDRHPAQPNLSAGSLLILKKAAADISQAAYSCIAKSADADFAGFDPDNSGRFDRDLLFAPLCLLRLR